MGEETFFKFFYYGSEDAEAYAFQRKTGWNMIWGSDSQGLNGDTLIVYRHVSDLPKWLQDYAREEEQNWGQTRNDKNVIQFVTPKQKNQVAHEQAFARKFELVRDLPNYDNLQRFAQRCIDLHLVKSQEGFSARVYMDKIIDMPEGEFVAWATDYALFTNE